MLTLGAEAAALGTQGMFWSLFHMGTPGGNLQQTKAQVCSRATPAHRSLMSFNDRSKSQGLECSRGSLEPQHRQPLASRVWEQLQVAKQCAKACSSPRPDRGVHMMPFCYCQWLGICVNAAPLLKKVLISSENQEGFVFSGKMPLPPSSPPLCPTSCDSPLFLLVLKYI